MAGGRQIGGDLPAKCLGDSRPSSWSPRTAHLVGIGGAGMRSLASLLASAGWTISGSDDAPAAHQASWPSGVHLCRDALHLPEACQLLICSAAVPPDHPQRRAAAARGLETISYAECLGRLAAQRHTVAVAGTHGKSTTAALVTAVLAQAGWDPSAVIGADLVGGAPAGRRGRSGWLVAEACEYRGNFLALAPQTAVVLGIEPDHFDCFADLPSLGRAFAQFMCQVPRDGLLLVRAECATTRSAALGAVARVIDFAVAAPAQWRAEILDSMAGRYRFRVRFRGHRVGDFSSRLLGRHQVLAGLAAVALAAELGVSTPDIRAALEAFPGLARRLEAVPGPAGIAWIEDYAHHPTAVRAGLAAVREAYPGRRVACVFQPHQATRTAALLDEFAQSLQNAEVVAIAGIWRAREGKPLAGEVTATDLAQRTAGGGVATLAADSTAELACQVYEWLALGDVVVLMGAGDMRELRDGVFQRF